MKIGLLGGTFDPIHLSHTKIAYDAYLQLELDEVWFIPVLHNPFQKEIVASNQQRLDMILLAIKEYPMFKISTIEIDKDNTEPSYTYDTIMELNSLYPEHNFYYILGFDQVIAFHKWYKANEIAKNVQIICFSRVGYQETSQNINDYSMLHLKTAVDNTSSSAIRDGDLSNVNSKVIDYFVSNGLYLDTIVQHKMSNKRYLHTVSVATLARKIAKANGYDEMKAYVTGMLHDVAKEMDKEKAKEIMLTYYPEHINQSYNLWHQWTGEYVAKNEFKVNDTNMLHAIVVHTTGCLSMSILDKIIFVADKLEPLRGFDSSQLIKIALSNIDQGFKETLRNNHEYLIKKKIPLDDESQRIYKKYVEDTNE